VQWMYMDYGAQSELATLRVVMVHKPGEELLKVSATDPWKWLFDAKPDIQRAQEEHERMVMILREEGVQVVDVGKTTMPNQYFTRDVGFVTKRGAVIGNFRHEIRRGEELVALRKLRALGVPILLKIKGEAFLEGGDVLFLKEDEILVGIGERTNEEGVRLMMKTLTREGLIKQVRCVPLKGEAFHLDMALNIASHELIALYPEVLPQSLINHLISMDYNVIEVPYEDFKSLALNWLVVRPGKLIFVDGYRLNRWTRKVLEREGMDVIGLEVEELMKGRGGPRCMTLPILRRN